MIFYLSKFLPLFIYPVGASCLFLVLSIIALIRDRLRIAIAGNIAALAILALMGNPIISSFLVRSLEMAHVPAGPLPQAEAIVLLGGVAGPAFPPQPTVHLYEADRLVYAAELYSQHKAPLIVVDGTKSNWDKTVPSESELMVQVLKKLGVPGSAILQESLSRNTHDGGLNVRQVLLDHDIHKVLLITSALHMPRALAVFKHEGIDAIPAPTDFDNSVALPRSTLKILKDTALDLLPNAESLEQSSRALKEYVGLIAYRIAGWI
jgi:uncharacterized SAM-binding protein YcdF (DUF218 family)